MSDTQTCVRSVQAGTLPPQVHVGMEPTEAGFLTLRRTDRYNLRLKPSGGLWTSSLTPNGTTGWAEWCRDEDFGAVDAAAWWIVAPIADAEIVVIDGIDDLTALVETFPMPTGLESYGLPARVPDFLAMRNAGIAGVRLTEAGHDATRYVTPLGTSSWDCESTVWLRWCFQRVEQYREAR